MRARALAGPLSLALAWLALPGGVAAAEETPREGPRLHLALRTGFGLPLGTYADVRTLGGVADTDNQISDDTHGVIPLWLDIGYWLSSHLMLGGYFVYGVVLPKTASATDPLGGGCPRGLDCSASGVRFGLQAQYAFAPHSFVNPWLGLGVGYEWINSQIGGELFGLDFEASTSSSGLEFLHLQGGLDTRLAPSFALGPFAAISAMQYTSCHVELSGEPAACELDDAGWHGWVVFGVRGALGL